MYNLLSHVGSFATKTARPRERDAVWFQGLTWRPSADLITCGERAALPEGVGGQNLVIRGFDQTPQWTHWPVEWLEF